jgi:ATP-dependent Clp endopeptidase proteolytic subunit ClpP
MEEENSKQEEEKDDRIVIINNIDSGRKDDDLRRISLYGDIEEKISSDVVSLLMYFSDTAKGLEYKNPEDPDSELVEITKPIKMVISTLGGSAADMFSIYDTMRVVKESCDIETIALGKVMSAGVPLLAAGTKGKRKIGANCRVMIHSVIGGYHGSLTNMENEIAEIRWVQDRYVKCLANDTAMSEKQIKKILRKQVDVYLSAEEAVKFGIADEIV